MHLIFFNNRLCHCHFRTRLPNFSRFPA